MRVFEWNTAAASWSPITPDAVPAAPCLRAESWLHTGAAPRGFHLHQARFGIAPATLWRETLRVLARYAPHTAVFPRVAEFGNTFYLHIRQSPVLRARTILTWFDRDEPEDPRTQPLRKGPDLTALGMYRTQHLLPGSHDVILGDFAETTTGALVGWNEDALVLPTGVHLPSTTQQLVAQRARGLGISIVNGPVGPDQPLWFLNAVQGISPVTALLTPAGARIEIPQHPEAAMWRAWWHRDDLGVSRAGTWF